MARPALEHLPLEKGCSFVVKEFDYPWYPTPWHYHPEYELVLVTSSTGKRFIGDHISDFRPGNLALLGPNIPHTYRNDEIFYIPGKSALRARSIVIHFTEDSLGKGFLELPESAGIRGLLERAVYGLDITGDTADVVSENMHAIVSLSGISRWICLVEMLGQLAASSSLVPVTSSSQSAYNARESDRLCNVFDWVTENFEKEIRLPEAAAIAGMQVNAFSRFFALRTRKTFSAFVQELRLRKAASLLTDTDMPVTAVCFDCGYNNVSNFNRQFLNLYKMNPLAYRKTFLVHGFAKKIPAG
ncbi:MAG: AraC family transcriptional regulator [Chitinophagaceae bacterium]|nr:MAG: AraC family transcriptional regulator [Chitinophagaceae bacterium]